MATKSPPSRDRRPVARSLDLPSRWGATLKIRAAEGPTEVPPSYDEGAMSGCPQRGDRMGQRQYLKR